MAQESGYVPQAGGATRWHDTVRRTERRDGRPAEFTSAEVPADTEALRSVANPRRTVLARYPAVSAEGLYESAQPSGQEEGGRLPRQ